MSYVASGTFSTFMSETSGSTFVGRMRCSVYESERSATRVFGVHSARSASLSTSTMYLPSVDVLTSTRALALSAPPPPPAPPAVAVPAPAMTLATSPM